MADTVRSTHHHHGSGCNHGPPAHVAELDARITEVQAMAGTLGYSLTAAPGDGRRDYPILADLVEPPH